MNPMQMMSAMMNPMGFMMKQFVANPMFRQAQQMAEGKTPEQIKETCKNLCKQRGIDFDQAWAQFQSQFPMG